jgi:DNA-directed RNA polymerase specialized sigma24 family protein
VLLASQLDADQLLDRYCALVYGETGSYAEAGRRLGLDRRTVKARVDEARAGGFTAAR